MARKNGSLKALIISNGAKARSESGFQWVKMLLTRVRGDSGKKPN
jgi:hypothetical protein